MYNDKLTQSIAEAAKKCMDEELKGQQHKLDVNKNNKIDAEDLKHLRAGKKPVEEAMQKADVPAYLRKQKGEKPLSVADVKGPRPDSISSKEGLAKLRNEETEELNELSKDTLKSYRVKSIGRAGEFENKGYEAAKKAGAGSDKADKLFNKADAVTVARQRAQEKMREEVEQIEEADIEKTATGMRVYGSSYGNSVRARREQVKKSIDTAKGPKMKDIESIEAEKKKKKKFSEMVETYVQSGIQGLFEGWKKVKEEATNDEFKSELEKQKAKAAGTAPQADVAKAAVQAVQSEEVEQLDELSPGTLKSYIKGAKASKHLEADAVRVAQYKDNHAWASDATQVMNKRKEGIKTAKAKLNAEEVEQLDELKKSTLGSYVKKASKDLSDRSFDHGDDEHRQYGMGGGDHEEDERVEKDEKKIATRQQGINRAATRLSKEEVEQIDELSLDTLKSAAKKNAEKAWDYHMDDNKYWARKSANRALNLKAKVAQKERQMKTNEDVEQVEERSLTEPEMKKREEVVKSMKKGIQGFKDRYGDRAKEVMYATATKIAKKD